MLNPLKLPVRGNRLCIATIVAVLTASLLATPTMADPPSFFSKLFRKKAPTGPLELKPENGPWLIMAMVVGNGDQQQRAHALATELRDTLRMPVFVMARTAGSQEPLSQWSRTRTDLRTAQESVTHVQANYANGGFSQGYAVLVGEFASTEDPRIEKTLKTIRTLRPRSLEDAGNAANAQDPDANWIVQKHREARWARTDRTAGLGPMGRAFVTRNPMLPAEYFFDSPELDSFVTDLNKNVEYSLLDCPGKYTVRVASFTGKEATGFGNIGHRSSRNSSQEPTNVLDHAAAQAHRMTASLREKHVEAYEFHDKYGSYVSIGSFDTLGSEVQGQFQYNPDMAAVSRDNCGYRDTVIQDRNTGARRMTQALNCEGKIPFDVEGKPMAVPRKAKSLISRSLLGRK